MRVQGRNKALIVQHEICYAWLGVQDIVGNLAGLRELPNPKQARADQSCRRGSVSSPPSIRPPQIFRYSSPQLYISGLYTRSQRSNASSASSTRSRMNTSSSITQLSSGGQNNCINDLKTHQYRWAISMSWEPPMSPTSSINRCVGTNSAKGRHWRTAASLFVPLVLTEHDHLWKVRIRSKSCCRAPLWCEWALHRSGTSSAADLLRVPETP